EGEGKVAGGAPPRPRGEEFGAGPRPRSPPAPPPAGPTAEAAPAGAEALPDYLDSIERKAILEALGKTGFNRTAAAKLLGITFRQLRYRMQRLGIKEDEARS